MKNFQNELFNITTILETNTGKATGFFYSPLVRVKDHKNPNNKYCWARYDKFYLITNRHVLFDANNILCEYLIFKIREIKNNIVEWHDIRIEQQQLKKLLLQHDNKKIDVVIIDTTEIITDLMKNGKYILPTGLTSDNLPKNQPLKFEVSDDIIVISYPRMFYDEFNKFPIIKSGIIASAYGMNFNNQPLFQIDAQLFPGSSGGLVLSKPNEIAIINGKLMKAESKQYVFLGIILVNICIKKMLTDKLYLNLLD